jgi:hypothetical protein
MTRDSSVTRDGTALAPREAAILLALLTQNQPISNGELRDRFGFTLVGQERLRLNQLGLVESGKIRGHGNVLFHQVTDAAWERGWRELAPRAEATRVSLPAGVFFAFAEGVHRYLDRERRAISEVLGADSPRAAVPESAPPLAGECPPAEAARIDPSPPAAPAPASAPASSEAGSDLETAIRAAYARLAAGAYDWVRLADVRPLLDGAAKAQVDRVLRRMARQPDVRVVPDEDQKSLTAADRAAAVRIGEHDNHLLLIGPA